MPDPTPQPTPQTNPPAGNNPANAPPPPEAEGVGNRPGDAIAARPLQFIWLADCSGTMNRDGKIQALNNAIRAALPEMRATAAANPFADVQVRALKFSNGASWHIRQPTPVADFQWVDLSADGVTDLGRALKMVAEELRPDKMPARGFPPVLVLVSDGQPTDDYEGGLEALRAQPWGRRAVRLAIAIGQDADVGVLEKFVDNPEIPVLRANNPEMLARQIRFVSTNALQQASAPPSQPREGGQAQANVRITMPPDTGAGTDVARVW